MRWEITDKGDQDCRRLADAHYSRQTPGARSFTRNGQNLVFVTPDLRAVWVTFRPTPGKATRPDKLDAWECALFRNTGPLLSSDLIAEAHQLSVALWGTPPPDGFITFVKPECVRSPNPGYCYKMAGWRKRGQSTDGKPRLDAPPLHVPISPLSSWKWHGKRGGLLREKIEGIWLWDEV